VRGWPLLFFGASVAYAAAFAAMLAGHLWLWQGSGGLMAYDFVDVYAAGKLALAGHAPLVYDWPAHKAAESAALGRTLSWADYYGWHYPPPFLFAAAAVAVLPYLTAFFAFSALTLPLYLFAMRRIAQRREAWLAAFAFPATLFDILIGQNGFLSAALIGGALLLLEAQPVAAGILFGLLSYKPQLGLLVPLALAAGGHWRSFCAAAATVILMVVASAAAFGTESWVAFVHSIAVTSDATLVRGLEGFGKLHSVFGLARWAGADFRIAMALQGGAALLAASAVMLLWRSRAAPALKASGLVAAALLATPYLYVYDLPVLAVGLAFLYRHGRFDRVEIALTALASAAILVFPVAGAPTGLIATFALAAMVFRRTISPSAAPLPAPA
jgi:hypothetical protein